MPAVSVCLLFMLWSGRAAQLHLQNGVVKATVDELLGLVELSELGADKQGLTIEGDAWSITIGDFRYTPGMDVPTTTTTTQWVVMMGYACNNGDGLIDSLKTGSIDECEAACRNNTPACREFSWKADGSCWHYPSAHPPGKNHEYNCGYNVVLPKPAPERICNASSSRLVGASAASLHYACGEVHVQVTYTLRDGGAFVEKRLTATSRGGEVLAFKGASMFDGVRFRLDGAPGPVSWRSQINPFSQDLQIAGFVRWSDVSRGAFISVANPWATFDAASTHDKSVIGVYASFFGDYNHSSSLQGQWFQTEPAVIGLTTLSKYTNEDVNTGERVAFQRCVESYQLDGVSRQEKTVKVMVAWDANDYQIDVGTEEGRTEYKRIIDRNAEFGITHIVYEPRNTLHSSRFNSTDGWGWEEALWFSMGEQIREGRWDPRTDDVPEDILDMVKYAHDRNVKFLAYVYPCLGFEKMRAHFVNSPPNALSLAPHEVQSYLIDVMSSFMQKSGAAGFAWDHDIFAGKTNAERGELQYAQWRGWMNIVGTLRERFPEMVMDHRQTAHIWGPWYQLAGSYAEPIAGDENPETYGVPIPSLHTDHVAADNTRRINYIYSTRSLLPPSRVPGFIFHQTERTDDDGTQYCTVQSHKCVNNSNTRDFDLLGYKYSLLSTIGTAGLNNVITMIPARDPAEFELFPQADLAFIKQWLAWTDVNIANLRHTQWIPTLGSPQLGNVDGTHSMAMDEGFLFLFNPNMREMSVQLQVDESLGLSNSSSDSAWEVHELYPRADVAVATWKHGDNVNVAVGGSDVRVLALKKTSGSSVRLIHATMISSDVKRNGSNVDLTSVTGPAGQEIIVPVRLGVSLGSLSVSVNDVNCGSTSARDALVSIKFAGEMTSRVMPVSPDVPPADFTGGWFNTTFTIPVAVKKQLDERDAKYPVPWTRDSTACGLPHCVDDSKATWLIPSRLLLNPFVANPNDKMAIDLLIDGKMVELKKSYNSRGRNVSNCFLAFYYDASDIEADVPHTLAIHFPPIQPGTFHGLFWENVETEYSEKVLSCSLVTPVGAMPVYV